MCRQSKGADPQRLWRPQLEPPAALAALSLVLVGPKKPPNVGSAARLCNCFECDDLRVRVHRLMDPPYPAMPLYASYPNLMECRVHPDCCTTCIAPTTLVHVARRLIFMMGSSCSCSAPHCAITCWAVQKMLLGLQVVDSSCNIRARSSLNAAMGGQRLLWQAENYSALPDAIADCAYSIAFGRWAEGEEGLHTLGGHLSVTALKLMHSPAPMVAACLI